MKTVIVICAMCVLFMQPALAQTAEVTAKPLSDSDIQLLRSDVQADKNDIITHTMAFTDQESAAFWPVYRDYARDQQVIGDDRWKLIKDYAANYDTLDDAKADDLAKQMFSIDSRTTKLREDYWPKFEKAIGGKRAAKFYQVDNRLSLIINLKLTSEIPLLR
jgi:hypothetical protein